MRSRILVLLAVLVTTFLLVTNPVVADAARLITGKDIKNGSVTGADVKNGSISTRDVKNGSISTRDVKNHSLTRRDFRAGQLTPGPTGPAGPAGADGVVATGWVDYNRTRDTGGVAVALPADGSTGDVVAIGSGPGQRSGPVVLTGSSRLFVSATASLRNAEASMSRTFECSLELRPAGRAARRISLVTSDDIAGSATQTLSITTSEAVQAGTYDVVLRCSTSPNNANGSVTAANISVLAARTAG